MGIWPGIKDNLIPCHSTWLQYWAPFLSVLPATLGGRGVGPDSGVPASWFPDPGSKYTKVQLLWTLGERVPRMVPHSPHPLSSACLTVSLGDLLLFRRCTLECILTPPGMLLSILQLICEDIRIYFITYILG